MFSFSSIRARFTLDSSVCSGPRTTLRPCAKRGGNRRRLRSSARCNHARVYFRKSPTGKLVPPGWLLSSLPFSPPSLLTPSSFQSSFLFLFPGGLPSQPPCTVGKRLPTVIYPSPASSFCSWYDNLTHVVHSTPSVDRARKGTV